MADNESIGKALSRIPQAGSSLLRQIMEIAINGNDRIVSAKVQAGRQLARNRDADKAINTIIRQHVALASVQGAVTNIGGYATMVVGLPLNIVGLAILQARMAAAIIHLRGYDVDAPRTRTALAMCLLGEEELDRLIKANKLPSMPMAVATAPVFDPMLDLRINAIISASLASRMSAKRMLTLGVKRVPIVGGGVGAAVDGWDTHQLGLFVARHFVSRRRIEH